MHLHTQLLVQGMFLARKALESEFAYLKLALLPYGMLTEVHVHIYIYTCIKIYIYIYMYIIYI